MLLRRWRGGRGPPPHPTLVEQKPRKRGGKTFHQPDFLSPFPVPNFSPHLASYPWREGRGKGEETGENFRSSDSNNHHLRRRLSLPPRPFFLSLPPPPSPSFPSSSLNRERGKGKIHVFLLSLVAVSRKKGSFNFSVEVFGICDEEEVREREDE